MIVSGTSTLTITDQLLHSWPSIQIATLMAVVDHSTQRNRTSAIFQDLLLYGLPTISSMVLKRPTEYSTS
jgi:hypothetical protein